jgi:2-iminobutanoate/2-iminopropanoate deaminase
MSTYGPYTPVRQAGNLFFVSGQVGIDPSTKTAPTDAAGQASQALLNLKNALEYAGASMNDVAKTTVFLTNMDDFAMINTAYEQAFKIPRPARSTVAVRELPRVAGDVALLVEIEAVAYKDAS